MNNELYADLDIIGQRIIPDVKTIKNDEDSIISTLNSMNCSNTSYESYIINAKDRIGRMIDVTNTILNSIYNKWDNLYKTKNMKIDPTVFNSDFIGPVMRYSPETTEMTQENSIVTSFDYAMYEQFIEELQ